MIRYQLRLHPDVQHHFCSASASLSREALEQLVDGSIVHGIESSGFGYPAVVDLELDQHPNDEVLNTILAAVQRCGYQLVEGEVTEWVDARAEGALLGLFGGAGSGAATKNDGLVVLFGILGAFLGHLAGGEVRKHEVIYQFRRAYPGTPLEIVPVNGAKAPTITLRDWLATASS